MLRFENVATPATALAVVAPDSVAPAVPDPGVMTTWTLPVNVEIRFPKASCPATFTAGVIVAPAVAADGGTVKPSWLKVPALIVNALLVAPLTPVALAPSV